MELHNPVIITPRLLAGVAIGGGFISIEYSPRMGDEGRTRYRYHIDPKNGRGYSRDDLQSGCQGGGLQEGLASLLSFLSACGESVNYQERTGGETENAELFPARIGQWCAENSDELSILGVEVEERENLIVE
jgi:hypothetical protein